MVPYPTGTNGHSRFFMSLDLLSKYVKTFLGLISVILDAAQKIRKICNEMYFSHKKMYYLF
jgi:hypothetical protein